MGLFSSKKTVVVSSTVYNMAGEDPNRPSFLKSSMFSAIMSPYEKYLGETLVTNYLTGPGMKQRQVFSWAVRNNFPGLPTFSVSQAADVSLAVVKAQIPVPALPLGLITEIQDAFVSDGDYDYFTEQYVLNNYPLLIDTDYVSEYDKDTGTITIQFEGGSTATFTPTGYDPNARYVIAHYYHQKPESVQPMVTGTAFNGVLSGDLPSFTGYTLESTTDTGSVNYTMNRTQVETKSYSDGRPDVVTTTYPTVVEAFMGVNQLRTKIIYNGNVSSASEVHRTKYFYHLDELRQIYASSTTTTSSSVIVGGVTETVTTVTTGDFLRQAFNYRIDTQVTILGEVFGGAKLFIYKVGTGNATLDALDVSVGSPATAEFYPFIPVRLNNVSITAPTYVDSGLYGKSRKLYRKATGRQSFEDLIEQVEANPDLAEIDYAYVQYGVSLNTQDNSCLRYLYQFFSDLKDFQNVDLGYMAVFQGLINTYNTKKTEYNAWLDAQSNMSSPLYGTPRPEVPAMPAPKNTTIKLKTNDPSLQDFDTRISWVSIEETTHFGLGKTGAKKGDIWFENGTPIVWSIVSGLKKTSAIEGESAEPKIVENSIGETKMFFQTADNEYKRLSMHGLLHRNFIYGGKSVDITAAESLADLDNSGFLVPLHNPTIRAMGLVHATQMSLANTFIVFNSYKIYKKKWYETFLGMLFLIFIVIVIASVVAPNVIGGMSGALGNNVALGTSLGFTGVGAIISGAFVNAIAGAVIAMALSEGATAIFGEKWGALIGSLLSFAFSMGMQGGFSNLSTLFTPANLLNLSSALANGYSGFVQAEIGEMQADMFENQKKYDREMDRIQKMIEELGGNNDLSFNPMQLTDSVKGNGSGSRGSYMPETLDEFIHRTTLTGSDIVQITLSLVSDYADLNLALPEA